MRAPSFFTLAIFLLSATRSHAQTPPKKIKTSLCSISSVFQKLQAVKVAPECRAGCAGGKCPPDWFPRNKDKCSAGCGKVFEPFWDECGDMLLASKMGGMDEMKRFYDHCLQSLYPPGSCGVFCNAHTYDCYTKEVHEACCDEKGTNCNALHPVPKTCPVGCALVFPEFIETCRDHIKKTTKVLPAYEIFEQKCLKIDSLALVEYALDLRAQGCTINLLGKNQKHRRTQAFLGNWLDSKAKVCNWDAINDYANEVDAVCCGADGSNCPNNQPPAGKCSPGCAVAIHSFGKDCGATLGVVMPNAGDPRKAMIQAFEKRCLASTDPKFFIKAIMAASCPKGQKHHNLALPLRCGKPACEYQFSGIPGSSVTQLTSSAKFRNFMSGAGKPDKIVQLTDWRQGSGFFQMTMKGDNLGVMLEGYFLAPATGSYTFRTNSDDASELWVSPVPNSQGNLIKVVELHDCHTVCKKNVQGTTKLRLSKGKSYYMRYFVKESSGAEYGRVGCTVNGVEYFPIPIGLFKDPSAPASSAVCGDGIVDPGEQCDAGADSVGLTACKADCTLPTAAAVCSSVTDPHFTTFSRSRYNFYGIGEYNLLHTADVTIQARHMPWARASGNVAVAIASGSGRWGGRGKVIQVHAHAGGKVSVQVDGKVMKSAPNPCKTVGACQWRLADFGWGLGVMSSVGSKVRLDLRLAGIAVELSAYPGYQSRGYLSVHITVPARLLGATTTNSSGLCINKATSHDAAAVTPGNRVFRDPFNTPKTVPGHGTSGPISCKSASLKKLAVQVCKAAVGMEQDCVTDVCATGDTSIVKHIVDAALTRQQREKQSKHWNPNVDECASKPCQHGGGCTDLLSAYSCDCTPAYSGSNCQTVVDPCKGNTCSGRGKCTVVQAAAAKPVPCPCIGIAQGCACCPLTQVPIGGACGVGGKSICAFPEYIGCRVFCCLASQTSVGGSTVRRTAHCSCKPGYSGTRCERGPCYQKSCSGSHGSCKVQGSQGVCHCASGYSGSNCERSPCYGNTCNGHGTCVVKGSSGECRCNAGYSMYVDTLSMCKITLNSKGGDEGFGKNFLAQGGGFSLQLTYTTYTKRDRVIVWSGLSDYPGHGYGGPANRAPSGYASKGRLGIGSSQAQKDCRANPHCLFDSGCVGVSNARAPRIDVPLGASDIRVIVLPNCQNPRSTGTAWTLQMGCVPGSGHKVPNKAGCVHSG